MSAPRKIITGLDEAGQWRISADSSAERTPSAFPHWIVWGSDRPVLGEASPTFETGLFPPPGGIRMAVGEFLPDNSEALAGLEADPGAAMEYLMHGGRIHDFDAATGSHRTETIDLMFILSGSVEVIIGDGDPVTLHPGDSLVLTGALHRWRNPGTSPTRYGMVMVGVASMS